MIVFSISYVLAVRCARLYLQKPICIPNFYSLPIFGNCKLTCTIFCIQEGRTLEMNNVQCGVWHGRGDTICLGSNGEGNKAFAALKKASLVPIKSPGLCGMDRTSNAADEHEPLVSPDQLEQV